VLCGRILLRRIIQLLLKETRWQILHCCQLIGTSSEASKYRCEFTLGVQNCIEQISNTFLVRNYTGDYEKIFNSRKFFNLDEETAKIFVLEEKIELDVTLHRV